MGTTAKQPHSQFHFLWLILGQNIIVAKQQWKDLKATYQEHVEAIRSALPEALLQVEEAQRKRVELQEAIEQLQAKVHLGNLRERKTGREGKMER